MQRDGLRAEQVMHPGSQAATLLEVADVATKTNPLVFRRAVHIVAELHEAQYPGQEAQAPLELGQNPTMHLVQVLGLVGEQVMHWGLPGQALHPEVELM